MQEEIQIRNLSNEAFPLEIIAGKTARKHLAEMGWQPELFKSLVGASGGAKLLGLGYLDRIIFGDFLQRSHHQMELYGSSIGSWRHAALASPNPANAIAALQERYLNQTWDENETRSATEVVDELCDWVLDGILTPGVAAHITKKQRFETHIVTARGRGLNSMHNRGTVMLGMAKALLVNIIDRRFLEHSFQRAVFSSGKSSEFLFKDFDTVQVPLTEANLRSALLASGSVPLLMSGRRNIEGAPKGQYWDGGIIDYHFDFTNYAGEGLVLYPHFSTAITTGWFDKALPWRRISPASIDRLIVVAPSKVYVRSLPNGKIPDRRDFKTFKTEERMKYWNHALESSKLLAEAFNDAIEHVNPLEYVSNKM